MGRGGTIFGAQGLKFGDFVKKKEPQLPHLKDYFSSPERLRETTCLVVACFFWHFIVSNSQYHSIPVSITRHSPENLYNNTNPYKLLWTGEKRNFIEQDPNTGVYHKTAHYYEVYPKHAA